REAVESVVRRFVEGNVSRVVPEGGMNVVGATPYAERLGETAAVEGRITRTLTGVAPNRGVRFGASSHVARFLLAARERDPNLQFAVNCRFDDGIERALAELAAPAVEIDRDTEPDPDEEGTTMGWAAHRAFERADGTPVAVYDRGDVGKEAVTRVLDEDAGTAAERVLALAERAGGGQ
ncbi:MAG: bifunctional hydroxymethylpyrimidine kinase/phosphomethylpyrimidine kinase, partial [Actinobacteria bacterium QS_8_72_14]